MSAEIIELDERRARKQGDRAQQFVDELISELVGRPVHVDPDDPNAVIIRKILAGAASDG